MKSINRIAMVLLFACSVPSFGNAQQDAVKNADPIEQLHVEREKEMVAEIYAQTQTAKSASDYTKLIDDCRTGLDKKISDKNRKYLNSLIGWALNRRGNSRCDLAKDLRDAQNVDQANELFESAIADFNSALESNAKNWRPHLGIGIVFTERGEYLSAIERFTEVCELVPGKSQGWFNRAEIYYELERFEKALSDYEKVIEINTADLQAITGRAHCLTQLSRLDEALVDYQVVSQMLPKSAEAMINVADCQQAIGNWQEAYDGYFSAATAKPTAAGYKKTAWMLATCPIDEFNRPQMALTLAQKAIQLGGETMENLDTLAAAQAASGDFTAAQTTQRVAIAKSAAKEGELHDRMALYVDHKPFRQEDRETGPDELLESELNSELKSEID